MFSCAHHWRDVANLRVLDNAAQIRLCGRRAESILVKPRDCSPCNMIGVDEWPLPGGEDGVRVGEREENETSVRLGHAAEPRRRGASFVLRWGPGLVPFLLFSCCLCALPLFLPSGYLAALSCCPFLGLLALPRRRWCDLFAAGANDDKKAGSRASA